MKTTAQAEGNSKANDVRQANIDVFALVSFLLNVGCVPWHPASNYGWEERTPAAEGTPTQVLSHLQPTKYTGAPDCLLSTDGHVGNRTLQCSVWRQCH